MSDRNAMYARRTVTPEGIRPACIVVENGRIAAVEETAVAGAIDLGDLTLMPGLVDSHVHLNEPGRTEWEGFANGTRAAEAGGVTTVVDMPLNSVPATTSVAALEEKRRAAAGAARVDYAFWGGVVPGNAGELNELAAEGVVGFKCFLVDSGVPEFPAVTEDDLRKALPLLARLDLPLLVHAELPGPIEAAASEANGDARAYATWLSSRPPAAEVEAIRLMIRLCREFRARVHIVHVSAAEALDDLRRARGEGLPLTAETCPHYLTIDAESIPEGATEFKCAPPIRNRGNQEMLWSALRDGVIDLVASDHSPCPPAMKNPETGDFMTAWGGIASLELGLTVMWTAAEVRGFGFDRVVTWMCECPAKLAGLGERKGRIAVGCDADLVAFDPEFEWTVSSSELRQRHPVTPYAGRRLSGRVMRTWVRGREVYGPHAADSPAGEWLPGARAAAAR